MTRARFLVAATAFAVVLPVTAISQTRTASDVPLSTRVAQPKMVPVAETSLLMLGMADPNLRGLEKILTEKPAAPEAWKFARGQALLIAETGNLLMMRPPKNEGQSEWLKAATGLRESASNLAKEIAAEDFARSRAALQDLATSCNKCHETFRVRQKISVFQPPMK